MMSDNAGEKNITKKRRILYSVIAFLALVLFTGCGGFNKTKADKRSKESAPDNGIPVVSITINPEEYQKVIESPMHTYHARKEGSVRIDVPKGYKSEFGEIDTKCIGIDLPLSYIRGRGNSTWLGDKKSLKLKLNKKGDILGMGKSKHWLLISNTFDSSLMRNRVMLEIGRRYGLSYTPKDFSVDLYVNGEYKGNYILSQSVEIGKSEVDIDKIPTGSVDEPVITGGYLLAMYPYPKELPGNTFVTERGVSFRLKEPAFETDKEDDDDVGTKEQRDYITRYLQKTEDAIFGDDLKDKDGVPWTDYMDMESAAKYWWIQQVCENGDAYRSDSTYLYKEKNGKLYWGPIWDYDIALNPATYEGDLNSISMIWLDHLRVNDEQFRKALLHEWKELEPILEEMTKDGGVIDGYAKEIDASWEKDKEIWHNESGMEDFNLDTQVHELKDFIDTKRDSINKSLDRIGDCKEPTIQQKEDQTAALTEQEKIPDVRSDDLGSGISGTCYWRIDKSGNMTIGPLDGSEGTLDNWTKAPQRPWHKYMNSITSVSFKGTVHAQTCLAMFYHCYNLRELDLTGLDTSGVKMMRGMFAWCWSLKKLDVSGLDTSDATSMREMFLACNSLTSLDISGFDLSKMQDMRNMLYRCYNIESIILPKKESSPVENISGMFADCNALESVDMSGIDMPNVTAMRALFYRCYNLTAVDLTGIATSSVKKSDYMFAECNSLKTQDIKGFDVKEIDFEDSDY